MNCGLYKIPLSEYETIKFRYLNEGMNQNKLALKYGINDGSMCRILKKLGVK